VSDAIVKISWRRSDLTVAVGGIAGSSFTLASGIAVTSAHHMRGMWDPVVGYDACRAWVVETSGRSTEIKPEQLRLFPEYDVAIIDGFRSAQKYPLSKTPGDSIQKCDLLGYKANATPFQVREAPSGLLEIFRAEIVSAAQQIRNQEPVFRRLTISSADVNIVDKQGYLVASAASVGLSGGPMLDARDQTAIGICTFGLPADAHAKTQVGVLDLRHMPFA